MTSIFLSYARGDDEKFVHRLYIDLTKAGFDVWFDRDSMPSRSLTFFQEIRDAIAARARLILVVGPKAVRSDYVNQEWQFAYFAANKCVNPIVRLDDRSPQGIKIDGYALIPEDLQLLHAEDFRDDARYDEHLRNLIRQISNPLPPVGKLVAVPELPPGYRAQPERLKALRDMLLIDLQKPVVVSGAAARVGLAGMGGIGKSVLANSLAHHPEVQRAFKDNIYWISIGQTPNIEDLQRKLAVQLGDEGLFNDWQTGKEKLRQLLAERAALLILDDVWEREHADAFNVVGPLGRILLTTRDAGLVTALASRENHYRVELPSQAEAEALLGSAAEVDPANLPPEAREIITQCGRLPLAIALCGGMVHGGVSWIYVLDALRDHDLQFLSTDHPAEEQHRNAWVAMDVSLRALSQEQQHRFAELAVFGLDTGTSESAIATLWEHTAGMAARHSAKLLADLARRSLVQLVRPEGTDPATAMQVRLHDLLHNFATGMANKQFGSSGALHRVLLDAYRAKCRDGWPSGPSDGYFFQKLAYHLLTAGHGNELVALLFDFRWLKAKIGSSDPRSLQEDFGLLLQGDDTQLTEEDRYLLAKLRNVSGTLRSTEQLPTTLWGHFAHTVYLQLRHLLEQARSLTPHVWLRPITPSLANETLVQEISDTGHIESLTIGDTVDGYPIVAAVADWSPRFVRIWIGGSPMPVVRVPHEVYLEKDLLAGNQTVTAMNLPGDSRPVLLRRWTHPSHGNCCCLLDLSNARFDVSDRLTESLNQFAATYRDPYAIGPVIVLGGGEPITVGRIAGRLVLLSYQRAVHPQIVGGDGKELGLFDLDIKDERMTNEWRELVLQRIKDLPESDYIARLNRFADSLSVVQNKKFRVTPKKRLPAQAVIWDAETGTAVPKVSWSLTGTSKPVLVGEDDAGRPFLLHTDKEMDPLPMGDFALRKLGARRSIPLRCPVGPGSTLVLSHRRGRPVIVTRSMFRGIEVLDASTGKMVGHFSKHRDEMQLLAAGAGEDGKPHVASIGELGSRGRFSTSVRIWDVDTQTQISPTGTAHTGRINAVTSGKYRGVPVFATAGADLICVWPTRVVPSYSSEKEPKEIQDPNICGRVSIGELPIGYRHHDLGAVRPLLLETVFTWGARRSNIESLTSTEQKWDLRPPGSDGRRQGIVSSSVDTEASGENFSWLTLETAASSSVNTGGAGDVVSVWVSGEGERDSMIETIRRDGTRRSWMFSPRASWERQRGTWQYWHCVSIDGALANGTQIAIRVDRYFGDVVIEYQDGSTWKRLKYDPGCPATQCALGEDGQRLVVFDERGIAHHLELMIPLSMERADHEGQ